MARSKHRDDDDDRNLDEPEEDAAPDDATDADDSAAELEDESADADAAKEKPPTEPEDEEVEEAERPPRPRTPILTIVLAALNLVAVVPFLTLLIMDYGARQQWSRAVFMNHLVALGLPFADEEDAAPAAYVNRPRLRITGDELKAVYSKRPKAPGTPSVNEPFVPVDTIDQPVGFRIRPSQIDERVKGDLFRGVGQPVGTLNDEVARLKRNVPSEIEDAVTKYVAAQDTPEKKKAAAEQLLLPLAWSTRQVEQLQARIDEASKDTAKLDELLKDAVERRMLAEVLAPVNIYRPDEDVTFADLPRTGDTKEQPKQEQPKQDQQQEQQQPEQPKQEQPKQDQPNKGEYKKFIVEKIANIDDYSIQDLRDLLQKRFDDALAAKEDIDRRHQIAFLMVTLSQLKTPGTKTPLLDGGKLFDRTQVVCGLYEFTQAAANFPRTLEVLYKRVLNAIETDRDGYLAKQNKQNQTTVLGFRNRLNEDIAQLLKVKADIDFTVKRIQHLETQRARYEKEYNQRKTLVAEVTKKLTTARAETAQKRAELNQLQQELFDAQEYLSDAAARNAQLERQIRAAEEGNQPGRKKQ